MVHQRKLEAARELYGLSPTDEVPEDDLKARANGNGNVKGGAVNCNDYGLGYGEEAYSEEKMVEVVAETMVTLGMSTHTDRLLRLMVENGPWPWAAGYLKFNDAQNTVRLTLQEPTQGCNPNDTGTDASVIRESSIVVATFIHEYDQSLNTTCFNSYPSAANNCDDLWLIQEKASLFAADVEAFTMLIDHSVTSPKSGLATTSRQMQGMLFVGDNGNDGDVTDHSPCYVPPNSADGLDYFSVGTLLQATGVTLEGESYPGSGHSARYEGLTINLLIDYSNSRDWHGLQPNISYLYKPSVVPQNSGLQLCGYYVSTFKTTLLSPSSLNGQQMLKKDIHGHPLAVFDFTQLLLQLTTSLTLLALATVGVNILAQYVLRYRHYYSEALYDRTADFDNISFLESQSDNHLRQELEDRNLPTSGTRERMILRHSEGASGGKEQVTYCGTIAR
eukprot:g6092.t1